MRPRGTWRLDAGRVDAAALGYAWRDVGWDCQAERLEDGRLRCAGMAVAQGGPVFSQPGGARVAIVVDDPRSAATSRGEGAGWACKRRGASPIRW